MNRGLQNKLFNGTVPSGKTALQTVLDERRLELAFEGHRTFDVYRNKQDMNRSYWGYHLPGLKESDVNYNIPAPRALLPGTIQESFIISLKMKSGLIRHVHRILKHQY